MASSSVATKLMRVLSVRSAQIAYPTGKKDFSVMQPFPSAISAEEADPFLMCDLFGPTLSAGRDADPDHFIVDWHPHRGMDIATYLVEGKGRHADSMGNREGYSGPGMQWCSVGSGIEHAEAFDTPAGAYTKGFQIWINVPSARKMEDPRYGTIGPDLLPLLTYPGGVTARLLAGTLDGSEGPFRTVQPIMMLDVTLPAGARFEHDVPAGLDNAMAFVHKGAATVNGSPVAQHQIAMLDALNASGDRGCAMEAGPAGASVMVFAGKRLNQPIAWHGPFVMTTQAEIRETIREYQRGAFPPKRVAWDFQRIAAFPAGHPSRAAVAAAMRGGGGGGGAASVDAATGEPAKPAR